MYQIRSQQASIEKLTSDCQKKSALIQHHLADISLGRSSAAQDRNRTQRRQEGGIMAALFGGTAKSDLDAEVHLSINSLGARGQLLRALDRFTVLRRCWPRSTPRSRVYSKRPSYRTSSSEPTSIRSATRCAVSSSRTRSSPSSYRRERHTPPPPPPVRLTRH